MFAGSCWQLGSSRKANKYLVLLVLLRGVCVSTIQTKITEKCQTTLPKRIREVLKVKPGETVEWYIIQGMVVLRKPEKLENPVKFLTSQTKLDADAVKLVRETREEFE